MADAQRNVTYNLRIVYDEETSKAALASFEKAKNAEIAAIEKRKTAEERAAEKEVKAAEKASKEKERQDARVFQNRVKLLAQIAEIERKKRAEEAKAAEKAAKEQERAADREAKAAAKLAKDKEREAAREQKVAEQAAKERERLEARVFQNRVKLLAQMAEQERKAREQASRDYERSTAVMQSSQDKFRSSVLATSDAVMRVGRGIAMLGVSGDENLKRMLASLVKIQAAFDITKGGIEIYHNISEAVKAYRSSVQAATAAEAALAAARGRTAAAGGASAVSGSAGAGAGAAATVGGGFALTGAIVGIGAAAVTVSEALRGTSLEAGSFSRTIIDFEDGLVGAVSALFGFETSLTKIVDRNLAESRANETLVNNAALATQAQREAEQFAALSSQRAQADLYSRSQDLFMRRAQNGGPVSQREAMRISSLANESRINGLMATQQRAMQPGSGFTVDQALEYGREAEALAERQVGLTEERLAYERQIAQTAMEASRAKLQAAEEEKRTAEEILRTEKERTTSVMERFGQMTAAEQRQLIAVRARAESVGAANLSREERSQLRSIGTSSAERLAREGDIAAAQRAGVSQIFRAEDYAATEAAQSRVTQANVTIQDQRAIQVQIDADVQQIVDDVSKIYAQQYAQLEQLIKDNLIAASRREAEVFSARQTEAAAARMQALRN